MISRESTDKVKRGHFNERKTFLADKLSLVYLLWVCVHMTYPMLLFLWYFLVVNVCSSCYIGSFLSLFLCYYGVVNEIVLGQVVTVPQTNCSIAITCEKCH